MVHYFRDYKTLRPGGHRPQRLFANVCVAVVRLTRAVLLRPFSVRLSRCSSAGVRNSALLTSRDYAMSCRTLCGVSRSLVAIVFGLVIADDDGGAYDSWGSEGLVYVVDGM